MPSLKKLKAYQSSDTHNHNDRPVPSDPNAIGAVMRPVSDATAGGPGDGADQHNEYDKPYPRIQRGAVARGAFDGRNSGDDNRSGPAGDFYKY